jgi:hypothetical protein
MAGGDLRPAVTETLPVPSNTPRLLCSGPAHGPGVFFPVSEAVVEIRGIQLSKSLHIRSCSGHRCMSKSRDMGEHWCVLRYRSGFCPKPDHPMPEERLS